MSPTPWREVLAPYFADFDATSDSSRVSAALERIEADAHDATADDVVGVLEAWRWFLVELDRRIDPGWDPDEPPAQGVAPPAAPHGPVRPSGDVDPATVADPAERASYVAELRAAGARVRHHQAQAALRQIGRTAVPLFSDFVRHHGLPTGPDGSSASTSADLDWLGRAALGETPPGW